ncbi:hypothetical protein [Sinomicrobium pectinilyticum]|nr:hypothetical protein [Sinomicrobium pectinilyticum]
MVNKLLIPLSMAVFLSGYGQKITEDIQKILPEGEYAFAVIHFRKKAQPNTAGILQSTPYGYGGHRGKTRVTLSAEQAEKIFNGKDVEETTGMVINTGGDKYKAVFKDNIITFTPERDSGSFAVNCATGEFISNGRKVMMRRKKVDVRSSDNIFGSPWEGYRWKSPSGDFSGYYFTVGRLQNNGKVYIEIRTPEDMHYRLLSS